jgi:hypothetical protein
VIIDLQRFVAAERPNWSELEKLLDRLDAAPGATMSLEQLTRFHQLYERTAADLAKITTFSSEPETRRYLEALIARAYGEIHETRERRTRLSPVTWFFQTLPQTFRRHLRAFHLTVAITLLGCLFGGLALMFDPDSRPSKICAGCDCRHASVIRVRASSKGKRASTEAFHAPMEVPISTSGWTPASSSARTAPTWSAPRAPPPERTKAV